MRRINSANTTILHNDRAICSMLIVLIAFYLEFSFIYQVNAAEPNSFNDAVAKFKAAYPCSDASISPPYYDGGGRLFGCIDGPAKTAKYFIDEDGASGRVKYIKIMWNDWFKDIGYGLHADNSEAIKMLSVALDIYVPDKKEDALRAFRSDKRWSNSDNGITLTYRYSRGPAIDERLITIVLSP